MCKTYFSKVTDCTSKVLECWGRVLYKRGWLAFLISGLIMLGLSVGIINTTFYDNEAKAGSPLDGKARSDLDSFDALDFAEFELMSYIYKAKNNENLITITHFQ